MARTTSDRLRRGLVADIRAKGVLSSARVRASQLDLETPTVTLVTHAQPRRFGRSPLTRAENGGIHDHLGALAAVLGIANAKSVNRLVDQDPQLHVRRRVRVDHDPPRLLITPSTRLARNRLEREAEPERLGERPHRCQQMRVRVSGQRLARRPERSLSSPLDRIDLRPIEHEHGLARSRPRRRDGDDPPAPGLGASRRDRRRRRYPSVLARARTTWHDTALSAGLVADVWNPPLRASITGVVTRVRTVAYARVERDGVLLPSGPWVLEDVERTPRWLVTAKPADDPSVIREDGLLINLAIAANEIVPWD
jgi:hypothetical protein